MNKLIENQAIFVVIPAWNEARVIRSTILPLIHPGYSIVVVDDHSSDNTHQAIADLPIYYLRHPVNLGMGAALQTGMSFALQSGADFIVHFDADGQHQAQDLAALLEPLLSGTADVVIGSRFLRREDSQAVPFARRWLLRTAVLVNWAMTGVRLSDAHNGLRAMTRLAAQQIHLKENRYAHASEILIQIRQHRLRLQEVPVRIIYSEYSQAKGQSLWNAVNIVVDMLLRRVMR